MSKREKVWLRSGEATVFDPNKPERQAAMTETVIGDITGPVGYAVANLLGGQVWGHTRFFAVLDVNWMVRPPCLMVSKVTMKKMAYINLFGGPVEAATAKAVVDSVEDGVIPKDIVNDLAMIALIWLDPQAKPEDKDELYQNNYKATKLAIKRALAFEPTIDELLKRKDTIKHMLYR